MKCPSNQKLMSVFFFWFNFFCIPFTFIFGLCIGIFIEKKWGFDIFLQNGGEWVSGIGVVVAAFYSFRSAKHARNQSKTQLISSSIETRKKIYKSLMWIEFNLLNNLDEGYYFDGNESDILTKVTDNQPKIFITDNEKNILEKHRELFWIESLVFGKALHEELFDFYTNLTQQLYKQISSTYGPKKLHPQLSYAKYSKWLNERKDLLRCVKNLREKINISMEIPDP